MTTRRSALVAVTFAAALLLSAAAPAAAALTGGNASFDRDGTVVLAQAGGPRCTGGAISDKD